MEFAWPKFFMHVFCGIYFGATFVLRGFGIAAGAHALYDILVFALFGTQA
mgnify:CR=1 FL=1